MNIYMMTDGWVMLTDQKMEDQWARMLKITKKYTEKLLETPIETPKTPLNSLKHPRTPQNTQLISKL